LTDEGNEPPVRGVEHIKLIRDGVPDKMRESGATADVQQMPLGRFGMALRAQLVQEAQEAVKAETRETLQIHLADALQLLQELAALERISMPELETTCAKRAEDLGGFGRRFYILLPSDSQGEDGLPVT
jgi:predicted house-cleaning noncanonical NTP pyrophosphatase (MazG superfamily)